MNPRGCIFEALTLDSHKYNNIEYWLDSPSVFSIVISNMHIKLLSFMSIHNKTDEQLR